MNGEANDCQCEELGKRNAFDPKAMNETRQTDQFDQQKPELDDAYLIQRGVLGGGFFSLHLRVAHQAK